MKNNHHKKLFPDEPSLGHSRSELFGLSSTTSTSSNSIRPSTSVSSDNVKHGSKFSDRAISALGSNLHELSDAQINKLIQLKYNSSPVQLIKGLSQDLTHKELELILLRKKMFLREQELIKLCNEYGNLSSLEIDNKLNNLTFDDNVDKVLSELIDNALNEDITNPVNTNPSLTSDIHLSSDSIKPPTENKSNSWLSNWFNGHADNIDITPRVSSDSDSKSLINHETEKLSDGNNILHNSSQTTSHKSFLPGLKRLKSPSSAPKSHEKQSNESPSLSRVPVELDSINFDYGHNENQSLDSNDNVDRTIGFNNIRTQLKSPIMSNNEDGGDLNTDKYGFFNDINNLILKPLPQKKKSLSLDMGNKDSSLAMQSNPLPFEMDHKNQHDDNSHNVENPHDNNNNIPSPVPIPIPMTASVTSRSSNSNISASLNDFDVIGTTNSKLTRPSVDKLKEIGKLHDAKNFQIEKQWNVFISELLKDFYKYNNRKNMTKLKNENHVMNELINEEIFGLKGLNLIKIDKTGSNNNDEQSEKENFVDEDINKHYKQLHSLINQLGIPYKYRHNLWLELLGATNLKVAGEYAQLVKISENSYLTSAVMKLNFNQINLDLHRTMPSNVYFNDLINSQPGPNFYKLKRILYAFAVHKPEIGYCQGMNKIVGNLLLGLTKHEITNMKDYEEDIFWVFVGLIDEILPHYKVDNTILNYFDNESLKYIRIDQKIMIDIYFPKFMPKLYHHLVSFLNVQIEFITLNWWLSIFTENFLSLEIWFKIFDNLLISEKVEIKLISLTLSIFKILETVLLGVDNSDDIYLIMKNLNHNNSTKMNLKFSQIIKINNAIEKKLHIQDLYNYRRKFNDTEI